MADRIARRRLGFAARWRELAVAASLLLVPPAAIAAPPAPPATAAVGRVNVAGRSFCTGTLIDARRAVTAAHCLFDAHTGERAPLDEIHFVAGWDRGAFVAHAQPVAVRIAVGYVFADRRRLANLERDLAILEFDRPLAAPRLAVALGVAGDGALTLVHYSRARPHLVERDDDCRRIGLVGKLWRLDCRIEPGGSGAPVLVAGAAAPRLAAVAIGRTREGDDWITLALPLAANALLP